MERAFLTATTALVLLLIVEVAVRVGQSGLSDSSGSARLNAQLAAPVSTHDWFQTHSRLYRWAACNVQGIIAPTVSASSQCQGDPVTPSH